MYVGSEERRIRFLASVGMITSQEIFLALFLTDRRNELILAQVTKQSRLLQQRWCTTIPEVTLTAQKHLVQYTSKLSEA